MNYINFDKVCRSCGFDNGLQPIQDNFVIDLFQKLIDINYAKNDNLPQKICETCLQTVYNIQKFVLQCKTMDLTLKKYLSKLNTNSCNSLRNTTNVSSEIITNTNLNVQVNKDLTIGSETELLNNIGTINNEVIALREEPEINNETNTENAGSETIGNKSNDDIGQNTNVELPIISNESNVSERNEISNNADNFINETNELNVEIERNEVTSTELDLTSEINTDQVGINIETDEVNSYEVSVENETNELIVTNPNQIETNEITNNVSNVISEINSNELNIEIETNEITNNESNVYEINFNELIDINEITNNELYVESEISINEINVESKINIKELNVEIETNEISNNVEPEANKETRTTNELSQKPTEDNITNDQSNINTENKTNSKKTKKYVDLETVLLDLQNQFPYGANVDLLNTELDLVSLKGSDFEYDVPDLSMGIFIPTTHLLKFDDNIVIIDNIPPKRRKRAMRKKHVTE